jgi:N-acetylmuramoyl-L-alanine amidase
MRFVRCLCVVPLVLMAVAAAADLEPSATRLVINGQTRIYRTYGSVKDPELFAPIARDLQRFGLVTEWQSGRETVTLGWNGSVYRWRVAPNRYNIRAGSFRTGDPAQAEALEMGGELFLPVRTTLALMGGTVDWEPSRLSMVIQLPETTLAGRLPSRQDPGPQRTEVGRATPSFEETPPAAGPRGPVVTGLKWSEGSELALEVEATAPVRAQLLQLTNPNRLVIDLSPATFALGPLPEPRGAVRTIRTGQFQEKIARVVLELGSGHLTGTGIPVVPQSRFAIRLAGSSGPARPVAIVPRFQARRAPGTRDTRRLASRGDLTGRDAERLRQILGAGAGLQGRKICIDAGHGGHSVGATGITGLWEKDLTLQMAQEVARALRDAGATVIMTRGDDTFVSLGDRCEIANSQGADVFISIHCNSMPRQNMMSGTETYYCTAQSLDLARALHPQVCGVMAGRDGGIRRRGFFVIKHTEMPSVLLEVGYINQTDDEQKLADTNNQRSLAEAIRDGLARYFSKG